MNQHLWLTWGAVITPLSWLPHRYHQFHFSIGNNNNKIIDIIDKKLIIPSPVIFDIRMNADGTINKYKARLVTQGNYQNESIINYRVNLE
jgi:hypothetical protein